MHLNVGGFGVGEAHAASQLPGNGNAEGDVRVRKAKHHFHHCAFGRHLWPSLDAHVDGELNGLGC